MMPPNTCSSPGRISDRPIRSSGESHLLPRKGHPQDALFAGNNVELSPVNKVIPSDKLERGISLFDA
jgi:hypothetical protein